MTLSVEALSWATNCIAAHSDGDLFPRLSEMNAIIARQHEFAQRIAGKPLRDFSPGVHRRFIVPKDEISYRQATQLDPQDSIILAALMYDYGMYIEQRRLSNKQVFSYRLSLTDELGLYGSQSGWNDFWSTAQEISQGCGAVLLCDIADFYNQIYHHVVENQLIQSGWPNQE